MLSRFRAYFNPRQPGGFDAKHYALILAIVFLAGAVAGVGGRSAADYFSGAQPTVLQQPTPGQQRLLEKTLGGDAAATCYVPPAYLFRLTNAWAIIHSRYDYDWNVLQNDPCQDTDYMLPYAAQEELTLPGPSWVRYTFLWTGYADGSGYWMTFRAPNGGRFAYLHVHNPWTFTPGQQIPGGATVGHSGWPFSYTYSNGYCGDYYSCESDAHLCLVTDWGGAAWLYELVANPPKKPQPKDPFNGKLYEQWRVKHHKKLIPYRLKGKLTHGALLWEKHSPKKLGGVVKAERWFPVGRKGVDGYEFDSYQGADIYWWPRHPAWKPKVAKHRWQR